MLEPDTIAALATPSGRGAVALLRLSGPRAIDVLRGVAPEWRGPEEPRRALLTRIVDPGDDRILDRALVTFFPGPASYTGEDLVEISTHGGVLVPALVLAALERVGARAARPGEFTQRAYLNGKLDLLQAEAVRDLIEAGSEAFHRAAVSQMEGGLSLRISGIREQLIGLEALLMHHIDFPEEDEPPTPLDEVMSAGRAVARSLTTLLDTAPEGELLREGALAVLAGRPNSGKSSLFNALLGTERAIVTEAPGTTRDALEAHVSLNGYPFRLVDTAGIRETSEAVELLGIEVARRYLKGAQVILLCVSGEWGWGEEEERFLEGLRPDAVVIVLDTKADRFSAAAANRAAAPLGDETRVHHTVTVSAVDGRGLVELRAALSDLVFHGLAGTGEETTVFLIRKRQEEGVRTALREVEAFVTALEEGVPAEMASTHIRPAETALEELLGVISPDEILDRVFADFCIGK